jgi:DNA-binding LacI/PurR family transcriptional regulator
LKKQKNINIVAILGPRNSPPAQERREIYNQFLEKLYRSRGLYIKDSDYWTGLMKELEHIQNIQTTYLEINNWDKQEAKELVKSIYSSLQGNGIFYQTCFLCGNDQIAIGVNEALREQLKNEYKDERFLYIGFDGISEMEEFMGRGMIGATMKVNFQTMCEKAIEIVKNPRLFMKIPLQPLIPNQISNPDPHE